MNRLGITWQLVETVGMIVSRQNIMSGVVVVTGKTGHLDPGLMKSIDGRKDIDENTCVFDG